MHTGSVHAIMRTKKSYKCSICNFSFSQKASLKIHIESVNENKKSYQCSICDYFFFKNLIGKSILNQFMISVSYRSVQFVISVVIKKLSQKCILGQFIRRKSHMCSVCNFSFSLKSSLEIQSESVNENKKSFKCSFCDYFCSKKCDLKKY